MKTFTYEFEIGPEEYSEYTDETFCNTEEYEYVPSDEQIDNAIASILVRDYKMDYENAKKLIIDLDLYLSDYFDYELKEIFEDDARKEFEGE